MISKTTTLEDTLQDIRGSFGAGSLVSLARNDAVEPVSVIPTGSTALDEALGIGGLPRGRLVEVFGPEAAGKSTLVYHVLAEAQKLGGRVAYLDVEHSFDPAYAQNIGLDIETLIFSQPDTAEQALEIANRLVASGGLAVVAIDSVAALTPRAELDGEAGEAHVGLKARLVGQAVRRITAPARKTDCLVIWVNQLRERVGVLFGSPETQPGGRALKYGSAVRIDLRIKDRDEKQNRVRATIVKNKVSAPYRKAEFRIVFGKGIVDLGKRT